MDSDCSINPDFCNFNRVYMPYCDGNSFSGNCEDPVIETGEPLYFRGHRITASWRLPVLDHLTENHVLSQAEQVILTGCSAGGLAVYLHADFIDDKLKGIVKSLNRYKAVSVSGFFLDHNTPLWLLRGRSHWGYLCFHSY